MFIEKAKLENLKTLKLKDKADFSFEIKAEDVFLYGQAKGGTKRWIVFHDKSYKPFQVSCSIQNPANGISNFLVSIDL